MGARSSSGGGGGGSSAWLSDRLSAVAGLG